MTDRLKQAIRQKYGTPERAMAALGLPASLLRASDRAPPRARRAYDQEETDLDQALSSGSASYSERLQLVIKFLKGLGKLNDKDLVRVEALLRGDDQVVDEHRDREEDDEPEPAMDSRPRRLASRIRVL